MFSRRDHTIHSQEKVRGCKKRLCMENNTDIIWRGFDLRTVNFAMNVSSSDSTRLERNGRRAYWLQSDMETEARHGVVSGVPSLLIR